jgi:hypothetical protein
VPRHGFLHTIITCCSMEESADVGRPVSRNVWSHGGGVSWPVVGGHAAAVPAHGRGVVSGSGWWLRRPSSRPIIRRRGALSFESNRRVDGVPNRLPRSFNDQPRRDIQRNLVTGIKAEGEVVLATDPVGPSWRCWRQNAVDVGIRPVLRGKADGVVGVGVGVVGAGLVAGGGGVFEADEDAGDGLAVVRVAGWAGDDEPGESDDAHPA